MGRQPQFVDKGWLRGPLSPGHVFPAPGGAAGETRRETLLRKASEPAAHVAGFGLHLEGFGPPSLPHGVLRRSKSEPADRLRYHVPAVRFAHRNMMFPSLQG